MWDLPGPGIEPVSPALAGGFLTTVPPGKSSIILILPRKKRERERERENQSELPTFLQLVKAESVLEEARFPNSLPVSLFSDKWYSESISWLLQAPEPLDAWWTV